MMPNLWLQGGAPTLQGSQPSLQGGSLTLQGSSPNLQPTSNPMNSGSSAGFTPGTSTTGGGGTTPSAPSAPAAPSAEQIAAQQQAQQVASLREEITARRQRANSIFAALTGAVQALAQEKRGELESGFTRESEGAQEDYTRQSQLIANRYRGRGLGDSSYKNYALEDAGEDYGRTMEDLGAARQSGLSQVGKDSDSLIAQVNSDQKSVNYDPLDEVGRREDGTYDPNKLIELRSQIDERIRQAEVQQTQLNTSAGFRGSLDKVAPYRGIVDTMKNSLAALARSAAPKVVKDRIAETIIGNYAPSDAGTWRSFYEEQNKQEVVA